MASPTFAPTPSLVTSLRSRPVVKSLAVALAASLSQRSVVALVVSMASARWSRVS